jgi:hypothetical protein
LFAEAVLRLRFFGLLKLGIVEILLHEKFADLQKINPLFKAIRRF